MTYDESNLALPMASCNGFMYLLAYNSTASYKSGLFALMTFKRVKASKSYSGMAPDALINLNKSSSCCIMSNKSLAASASPSANSMMALSWALCSTARAHRSEGSRRYVSWLPVATDSSENILQSSLSAASFSFGSLKRLTSL